MARSMLLTGEQSERRAPQQSGLPMHPACLEFEPQNLGVISVSRDGKIVEANEAFFAMTGYSQADLPLDMMAITPVDWHDLDIRKSRQLADNGYCLPWQKQILTRQGHQLPIVIGAAALMPTENGCQYFVASTEDLLHTDSVILEYQSRLRSAAVELSMAAERERRALAADLHDNVGQDLAIANLKLSKLRGEATGKIGAELDEIAAEVSNALGSCRRLSHALATPSLYKLGLVPAIKNLVTTLNQDQKLRISLQFDDEDISLPYTTRIILYRAVRELLFNVLKHAQATHVEISGARQGDMYSIVILDNGIGCAAPETFIDANPQQGLGLFLMRERLWHIGGTFELESGVGKGTRVTLVTPLEDDKNRLESTG